MKLRHVVVAVVATWAGAERVGGPRTPWPGVADPRLVLREWALEMHRAQVDMLKIDWGNPGFCTEWDQGFDAKAGNCRDGRRPIKKNRSRALDFFV
jgi:hypothetical protein